MLHVGEKPVDPLIVEVNPLQAHQKSTYTLYEDSSSGRDYMTGHYATTKLNAQREGETLTITIDPARGAYPQMPIRRSYQVELPGDWPPASVSVNGKALSFIRTARQPGWNFNGNTLTTVIRTESFPARSTVTVIVRRASDLVDHSSLLQGFAGEMLLLRDAYAELNGTHPVDSITAAMQTGNRIGYRPERALAEIEALPGNLASAQTALEKTTEEAVHADENAVKDAKSSDRAIAEKHRSDNQLRLARAKAALSAATHLGDSAK
jgi:alpha-glucosidase